MSPLAPQLSLSKPSSNPSADPHLSNGVFVLQPSSGSGRVCGVCREAWAWWEFVNTLTLTLSPLLLLLWCGIHDTRMGHASLPAASCLHLHDSSVSWFSSVSSFFLTVLLASFSPQASCLLCLWISIPTKVKPVAPLQGVLSAEHQLTVQLPVRGAQGVKVSSDATGPVWNSASLWEFFPVLPFLLLTPHLSSGISWKSGPCLGGTPPQQ